MSRIFCSSIVLSLLAGVAISSAAAQDRPTRDDVLTEAFRDVGRISSRSVLRVFVDGEPVGYAMAIEDGWAVTSDRVVPEDGNYRLETAEGETVFARVAGREGWLDVALLRFDPDAPRLPILKTGKPSRIGEWVVSPGIEETPLAVGVVSAIDRDVGRGRKSPGIGIPFAKPGFRTPMREYRGVIQHDSPLEKGQLGGPIVNSRGRWVGLNVAKPHRGTSYSTTAGEILAALPAMKDGEVTERPADLDVIPHVFNPFPDMSFEKFFEWMDDALGEDSPISKFGRRFKGFVGEEGMREIEDAVKEQIAEFFGEEFKRMFEDMQRRPPPLRKPPAAPPQRGSLGLRMAGRSSLVGSVEVERVTVGGPAEHAGIRAGDYILEVEGIRTGDLDILREIISSRKAGASIEIIYGRKDSDTGEIDERIAEVTLGLRRKLARRPF
ncbi:MAG: trypsin-like peptidase domain-containing protein [Planctomycetota bacterium]|nr:trypsin-like peptidase domain-containing protein [Planctomycetota bacterium]